MQELDTPLRLTWIIGGEASPLSATDLVSVAERIADAGVMFVTLEGQPLQHPGMADVLRCFSEHACQVMAVIPDDRGMDADLPLQSVALDAAPWLSARRLDKMGLFSCLQRLREQGWEPLLWLAAYKGYLADIPELLRFCSECGVARFKLSNLPIDASYGRNGAAQIPRPEDLAPLAQQLRSAAAETRDQVKLEIHDRFLWELLAAGEASLAEYGGCQAANSLAHVDAQGTVHPCSSWLEPLGSLLILPLDDIWASAARRAVRDGIAREPEGCAGCRDYRECFAGCRGLSACYDFANQGRDPLCGGCR